MSTKKTVKDNISGVLTPDEVLRDGRGGFRVTLSGDIKWEYYNGSDITYPIKDEYKRYYLYNKGTVVLDGVKKNVFDAKISKLASDKGNNPKMSKHDNLYWSKKEDYTYVIEKLGYVKQTEISEQYQIDYDNTRKESNNRYNEFKKDMLKHHRLDGNPKAEKAFRLAWEYGHSSGYSEVNNYMYDIADLILNDD